MQISQVSDTVSLGPLDPLLADEQVSDIFVNGPSSVFTERAGRLEPTGVRFQDIDQLRRIICDAVAATGRRFDERNPIVDVRLSDGSRLNAVLQTGGADGILVSIRRFNRNQMLLDGLLESHSAGREMIDFLCGCVMARLNIVVSGGSGTGKTTLLNALSTAISANERIVTIEDVAELQLQQRHVARLETGCENGRGKRLTTRRLLRNALRMRADRIIVGECRGVETLDMLQAMCTGHYGGMTTLHANDARDAVNRLEMLTILAAPQLPHAFVREQIARAVDIVVQVTRVAGGARKITQIAEVTGVQSGCVAMHDLFLYRQVDVSEDGKSQGTFHATGIRPQCLDRLAGHGVDLPAATFTRGFCVGAIVAQDSRYQTKARPILAH